VAKQNNLYQIHDAVTRECLEFERHFCAEVLVALKAPGTPSLAHGLFDLALRNGARAHGFPEHYIRFLEDVEDAQYVGRVVRA
jgi:hypothetical protein